MATLNKRKSDRNLNAFLGASQESFHYHNKGLGKRLQ